MGASSLSSTEGSINRHPGPLALKIFLSPLPWCLLSLNYRDLVIDMAIRIGQLRVNFSSEFWSAGAFCNYLQIMQKKNVYDEGRELKLSVCIRISI